MKQRSIWESKLSSSAAESEQNNLHIVVQYYEPVVDCVVKVAESDMGKPRDLIACDPTDIEVNACDGMAWTFTAYKEFGEIIFHRDLGYIYGIEELEEIGKLLRSYVPNYGGPWQKQEINRGGKNPSKKEHQKEQSYPKMIK